MNNPLCKSGSLLARTLQLIILVVFCNAAAAINSFVKADTAPEANIECLLNWAQAFYPNLFSPSVSDTQFFSPYTYRYYPNTNAYVGVSSIDNNVYYQGPNNASPQSVGSLSAWLAESGCGARPYPVIFIHGIASSADTWKTYRDYLINNGDWKFGGVPAYDPLTKKVNISCPVNPSQPVSCTGNSGDLYTLNFSDTQGLPFDVQGGELAAIIQAVLNENPSATKVLLISHSTGGLAARVYLQGLARDVNTGTALPYRNDVAKLITIGAPHQGSFWARACHIQFDIFDVSGNVGICDLLPLKIDPNSAAVEELSPNSLALTILNNLNAFPLPATTSYVSIIGTGQDTLAKLVNFTDGDGIVSDISQDLMMITKTLPHLKSVKIKIPFQECGNKIHVPLVGNIGETHTCEVTDIGIGGEILRNLH